MDCDPLTALAPDHEPAAEQLEAFWTAHVSTEAAPELTVLGLALNVMTGAKADTVTITDCRAKPPRPSQKSSYSVVLERVPVDQVPLLASSPCQPPRARHCVAFDDVQVKVVAPPAATVEGEAVSVIAGAATPDPVPPQVALPVVALPVVGCSPPRPPITTQFLYCTAALVCAATELAGADAAVPAVVPSTP